MRLASVGLILSYRCPARCAHCAYGAGPEHTEFAQIASLRRRLAPAPRAGVELFCLSGGEPFLRPDLVGQAAELARHIGARDVWVFTNGFWAEDARSAEKMAWFTRKAGITRVHLGADAWHSRHVPARRALAAARACLQAGLEVRADARFLLSPRSRGGHDLLTRVIASRFASLGLDVSRTRPWFVGRAAGKPAAAVRRAAPGQFLPAGARAFRSCPQVWAAGNLREPQGVEIDPFGNVFVCPGLSIGNISRRTLWDVIAAYSPADHPVIRHIVAGGPAALAAATACPSGGTYLSRCHLCYTARKRLRPRFPEFLTPSCCYPE